MAHGGREGQAVTTRGWSIPSQHLTEKSWSEPPQRPPRPRGSPTATGGGDTRLGPPRGGPEAQSGLRQPWRPTARAAIRAGPRGRSVGPWGSSVGPWEESAGPRGGGAGPGRSVGRRRRGGAALRLPRLSDARPHVGRRRRSLHLFWQLEPVAAKLH